MKIKLSKSQWELIGQRTGWIKKAQGDPLINKNENDKIKILNFEVSDPIDAEDVEENLGLESEDKIRRFTLDYKIKETNEYGTIEGIFTYAYEPVSLGFGTAPDEGGGYNYSHIITKGSEHKDIFYKYLDYKSYLYTPKLDREYTELPRWYKGTRSYPI